MEKQSGKRFLIEIKRGKEMLYSVTLTTDNEETAKTWGNKWIELNHYILDNPRVIVTEVVK